MSVGFHCPCGAAFLLAIAPDMPSRPVRWCPYCGAVDLLVAVPLERATGFTVAFEAMEEHG